MLKRVLRVLNAAAAGWSKGQHVNVEALIRIIRFVQDYANRFHQRMEEEALFPNLEREGIPREGGPLGVLLSEHRESERYLKDMEGYLQRLQQGEKEVQEELIDTIQAYSLLLKAHIGKEDMVILPLAIHAQLGKELEELTRGFHRGFRDGKEEAEFAQLLRGVEEDLGLSGRDDLEGEDVPPQVEPDSLAEEFLRGEPSAPSPPTPLPEGEGHVG